MPNHSRLTRAAFVLLFTSVTILFMSGCGSTPHNEFAYVNQVTFPADNLGPLTGGVAQLRVASDGTLTQIGPANLGWNDTMGSLLVHPSGKYLLIDSGNGNTYEYTIGSDGTLTANPAATINGPGNGGEIAPVVFTPDGRFLVTYRSNFFANNWRNYVSLFQLDSNGIPTLVNTLSADGLPLVLDSSGSYL